MPSKRREIADLELTQFGQAVEVIDDQLVAYDISKVELTPGRLVLWVVPRLARQRKILERRVDDSDDISIRQWFVTSGVGW